MTAIKGKNDVADDRDLHGWRKLVAETLKGKSVEALISHSADGLPIEPLYAAASETHSLPCPRDGRGALPSGSIIPTLTKPRASRLRIFRAAPPRWHSCFPAPPPGGVSA